MEKMKGGPGGRENNVDLAIAIEDAKDALLGALGRFDFDLR